MTRFAALPLTALALLLPAGAAGCPATSSPPHRTGLVRTPSAHAYTVTVDERRHIALAAHDAQIAIPAGFAVDQLPSLATTPPRRTCARTPGTGRTVVGRSEREPRTPRARERSSARAATLSRDVLGDASGDRRAGVWTTELFGPDPFTLTGASRR